MHNNKSESRYHLLVTWEIEHNSLQISAMLLILTVIIVKFLYSIIKRVTTLVPESLILILMGVGIGYLLCHVMPPHIDHDIWRMTPSTFFKYLLPCCVLDSAYNLHNRVFGDCIGSVICYAVLATVFNMVLIGLILFWFESIGFFRDREVVYGIHIIMVYASLIVAVDPVAVLAIFQEIGVELSLYYLVLGESLLNDAVTLVLYKIVVEFLGASKVSSADIRIGSMAFFTINLGAIAIGMIFGIFTCVVTRVHTHFEAVWIFLLAYFSYLLGDILGWSGIVAMITCGMIQTAYAFHNLEDHTLNTVRTNAKLLAEVCEAIIFLLIGVQIVNGRLYWHTSFNLCAIAACLIVRTFVVYVLTWALNRFNVNFSKITFTDQFILAYGGLRGAVALSLAIMLDKEKLNKRNENVYDSLVTSTLFIILFTVGVMGPTMKPLVKLLRIRLAEHHTISLVREMNEKMIDNITAGIEAIIGSVGRNSMRAWFIRMDEKYIRRCLQREPTTYNQKIVEVYEEMALVLHYASLEPENARTIMASLPPTIMSKHIKQLNQEHQKHQAQWLQVQKANPFARANYEEYFNRGGKGQEDFGMKYERIIESKKQRVMSMNAGRPPKNRNPEQDEG